jgi:hypothetical protein
LPSDPIVIFSPLLGTLIVLNAIYLDTRLVEDNVRAARLRIEGRSRNQTQII